VRTSYKSPLEIIIPISFDWRAKPFPSKNIKDVINWNHLINMLQLSIFTNMAFITSFFVYGSQTSLIPFERIIIPFNTNMIEEAIA
jgi:hypothetical protein